MNVLGMDLITKSLILESCTVRYFMYHYVILDLGRNPQAQNRCFARKLMQIIKSRDTFLLWCRELMMYYVNAVYLLACSPTCTCTYFYLLILTYTYLYLYLYLYLYVFILTYTNFTYFYLLTYTYLDLYLYLLILTYFYTYLYVYSYL